MTSDNDPIQAEFELEGFQELPHHSEEELRERVASSFLQYASYVIRDRAIPKIDDGLKPVQRRILYSLHLNDDGKFIKVANMVGFCMQFHPHGDASIADALVVLANKRYLIEGQGNFGNIFTGDRAAASRYIECRLTKLARNEIFNKEITEFVPSYDGRNQEPVALPAKLPLLLMLGAEGIAVGLSTRILPHNFCELLQAQIAILQRKPFEVLPDFQKGCLMDPSEYDDGKGSIKMRSRIAKKDNNTLSILDAPYGITSDSLISSIEAASKKGKIKIRSINDFTSEKTEIEIKLGIGTDPDNAIQALYAFTDCEISLTSRIIVIRDNRPVELSASDVLRYNTIKLVNDLERELKIKQGKLQEELHFKTLVQIFVENRIYKKIEKCKTNEAITKAVYTGFKPFSDELIRPLNDKDIEMLLAVQIRRISLFDINKHREDIERIVKDLAQIKKHLKSIVRYTINYLKDLLNEYGPDYPRLTEISTFDNVTAKEVAAKSFRVTYDRKKGYLGHQVNGAEFPEKCSKYDKLILVNADGTFRTVPVPDKLYVGSNLIYCAHMDRDQLITMVYRKKDTNYLKRFTFGGTILNKEYRCAPEKSKIVLFEEGTPEQVYIKYKPAPGQKVHQQIANPADVPVKSAKARGAQISIKKISNIGVKQPRNWDEKLKTTRCVFA
jgi:topoisomerase IV subunit A